MPRPQTLDRLRDTISALENRPLLDGRGAQTLSGGDPVTGLAGGVLHEVWADHFSHGGAAAGFLFGAAQRFFTAARPAILWLTLRDENREAGLFYAPGLSVFGFDPERLIIGRMQTITDILWAAEEALGCAAVAAVIVETGRVHKALDFTATRRLGLRAGSSGAPIFLLRFGTGREASAAAWRWRVGPAPSAAHGFDARAPGALRLKVDLEKGQGAHGMTRAGAQWVLRWQDNGFVHDDDGAKELRDGKGAALSGASSAALGDRLPQTA